MAQLRSGTPSRGTDEDGNTSSPTWHVDFGRRVARPLDLLVPAMRHICRLPCALCLDLCRSITRSLVRSSHILNLSQRLRPSVTDTLSDTPKSIYGSKSAKEAP